MDRQRNAPPLSYNQREPSHTLARGQLTITAPFNRLAQERRDDFRRTSCKGEVFILTRSRFSFLLLFVQPRNGTHVLFCTKQRRDSFYLHVADLLHSPHKPGTRNVFHLPPDCQRSLHKTHASISTSHDTFPFSDHVVTQRQPPRRVAPGGEAGEQQESTACQRGSR